MRRAMSEPAAVHSSELGTSLRPGVAPWTRRSNSRRSSGRRVPAYSSQATTDDVSPTGRGPDELLELSPCLRRHCSGTQTRREKKDMRRRYTSILITAFTLLVL